MKKNKFYITTPIYYVNAEPHLGHTYTTIAADVLARFHRSLGEKTFFLTGTDEHGAKIEKKAKEAGKEPKEFANEVAAKFQDAWDGLNISCDRFIRTTEAEHIKAVEKALAYMYEKGDIYQGKYKGLYCQGCEQFKNEKDLVAGKCPEHNLQAEPLSEDCYLFKMSKYGKELLKKIESDELKISPPERKNEIISFYKKEGLSDISFSRKNVKWGIPLPWDKNHTAYVWADAFLNYLTGLNWDGTAKKAPAMWPPAVQLMSKDILRVHATIWPAMLLSLGLPLPREIFIHGFFLVAGEKMSKTIGNVIAPGDLIKKYGVDGARYLLLSATAFGQDGDISWEWFTEKYNADLANGLGNLAARVSNLLEKNEITIKIKPRSDKKLIKSFNEKMAEYRFDEVLKIVWNKLRQSDEFLSVKAPWKMTDKKEIRKVLEAAAENIFNAAEFLKPFLPETAEKIIKQFSAGQIKKGEPLFPRIVE